MHDRYLDVVAKSAPAAEAKALAHGPLRAHLEGCRRVLHNENCPIGIFSRSCFWPEHQSAAGSAAGRRCFHGMGRAARLVCVCWQTLYM